MPLRIAIIGCGTAGQAAAIFLARAGHDITIFERAPTLSPIGAGLLLQPTGLSILHALGLLPQALEAGTRIHSLKGHTSRGRTILDLNYSDLVQPQSDDSRASTYTNLFGLGIHRGTLFSILQNAVIASGAQVLCDHEIIYISVGRTQHLKDQTPLPPSAPVQCFAIDSTSHYHGPFDLAIIADGSKSSLRNNCRHLRRNRTYPWGALWFVADDPDGQYGDTLSQVYRGTSRMIGFLPSGRGPSGARTVSMFWSVRCSRARPASLDAWKSQVREVTNQADPILEQIHSLDQLIFVAYHDVILRHCHESGVAYIGDAAHAMSPQLGQGANLALLDAAALTESLATAPSLPEALARYSHLRHRSTRFYQFASRWLTPIFQSGWEWLTPARDLLMGPMCGQPTLRRQMLKTLVGVKTGLLHSDPIPPLPSTTEARSADHQLAALHN
jgi:2-polyprenyl-6-methoxyphenol hydroxylase-like FAD-dependent oxidoreductase